MQDLSWPILATLRFISSEFILHQRRPCKRVLGAILLQFEISSSLSLFLISNHCQMPSTISIKNYPHSTRFPFDSWRGGLKLFTIHTCWGQTWFQFWFKYANYRSKHYLLINLLLVCYYNFDFYLLKLFWNWPCLTSKGSFYGYEIRILFQKARLRTRDHCSLMENT